jgi:hypothetical protein
LRTTEAPELIAASVALTTAGIEENGRLARQYLANLDDVPDEWQRVATFSTYGLLVTADELRAVTDAIDAIVRPLRNASRTDAPSQARLVRLHADSFLRTEFR